MPKPPYLSLSELICLIDRPARDGCQAFLGRHKQKMRESPGSARKHQPWPGGYLDHMCEVMNLAHVQFRLLESLGRPLPFTLSDAELVLFWHDAEKPWKYENGGDGKVVVAADLIEKDAQQMFRLTLLKEFDVHLTGEQLIAMRYAEGEGSEFSRDERKMNPLAAFCHAADVFSARLFHDHPSLEDDPWSGKRPSAQE